MIKEDETSFVWYPSWKEPLAIIEKEDPMRALALYKALVDYGTTGESTTLQNATDQAILLILTHEMQCAKERYENAVEAGKKGGCATKYDTEKAEQMVLEGATTDEIMEEIGCSKRCAQYYKAEFSSKNTKNESDNDASAIECNESAIGAIECNNNDASAISAISAIRCNNLDVDVDDDKDEDVDAEGDVDGDVGAFFTPTFAHEIFSLYQNLGLPLPKSGEATFLQYDMKKGFENIRQQHLSPNDVIEAVKNYAKALSARDSWYHARLSFDRFTREDTISRFLPDRFDLKIYTNKQIILNDEYDGRPW